MIPAKFQEFLGPYGELQFDGVCGRPVTWGHRIVKTLGPALFEELKQYGKLDVIRRGFTNEWGLILKSLTHAEALELYGPVTAEEKGPKGGFRSITFGTTRFIRRELRRAA